MGGVRKSPFVETIAAEEAEIDKRIDLPARSFPENAGVLQFADWLVLPSL